MLEKMKEIIAEQLNCDAESITLETSFKDVLLKDCSLVGFFSFFCLFVAF